MAPETRSSDAPVTRALDARHRFESLSAMDTSFQLSLLRIAPVMVMMIFSHLGFLVLATTAPPLSVSTSSTASSSTGPSTICALSNGSLRTCYSCSVPNFRREHIVPGYFTVDYLQRRAVRTEIAVITCSFLLGESSAKISFTRTMASDCPVQSFISADGGHNCRGSVLGGSGAITTLHKHIQSSAFTNVVQVADQSLSIAPSDEDALRCKVVALIISDIPNGFQKTLYVLPLLYADDVRSESYEVFDQCKRKVVVTTNPTMMVESFARNFLGDDKPSLFASSSSVNGLQSIPRTVSSPKSFASDPDQLEPEPRESTKILCDCRKSGDEGICTSTDAQNSTMTHYIYTNDEDSARGIYCENRISNGRAGLQIWPLITPVNPASTWDQLIFTFSVSPGKNTQWSHLPPLEYASPVGSTALPSNTFRRVSSVQSKILEIFMQVESVAMVVSDKADDGHAQSKHRLQVLSTFNHAKFSDDRVVRFEQPRNIVDANGGDEPKPLEVDLSEEVSGTHECVVGDGSTIQEAEIARQHAAALFTGQNTGSVISSWKGTYTIHLSEFRLCYVLLQQTSRIPALSGPLSKRKNDMRHANIVADRAVANAVATPAIRVALQDMVPFKVSRVDTKPTDGQKPRTSGLHKTVKVFKEPHYLPKFVHATLTALTEEKGSGATLVVSVDGRYFSTEAIQIIIKMSAANGVRRVWADQNGLLPNPAVSAVIRESVGAAGSASSALLPKLLRLLQLSFFQDQFQIPCF